MNRTPRIGRCSVCGVRLADHFGVDNRLLSCEELRDRARESGTSTPEQTLGYPEVTDQLLETIRRRLRGPLATTIPGELAIEGGR